MTGSANLALLTVLAVFGLLAMPETSHADLCELTPEYWNQIHEASAEQRFRYMYERHNSVFIGDVTRVHNYRLHEQDPETGQIYETTRSLSVVLEMEVLGVYKGPVHPTVYVEIDSAVEGGYEGFDTYVVFLNLPGFKVPYCMYAMFPLTEFAEFIPDDPVVPGPGAMVLPSPTPVVQTFTVTETETVLATVTPMPVPSSTPTPVSSGCGAGAADLSTVGLMIGLVVLARRRRIRAGLDRSRRMRNAQIGDACRGRLRTR